MSIRPFAVAACFAPVILLPAAGCSDLDPSPARVRTDGWSQVRLPDVPRDAAFDAAVYAMRQWFRLEQVLPADGFIKSAAVEYEQKGGTGRIRDGALGFKNRMRRTATLVVREDGPTTFARCLVRVERLDTADHRIFHNQSQFQDTPNETPIDRDAGISSGQDQVWTEMPRDRKLEADILDLIRTRTEPAQPTASSPS